MKRTARQQLCGLACLLSVSAAYGATVSPIQADYGNVFPTLTEQNLDVFRNSDPAPWYVTFNLLAQADVKLGAQPLPPATAIGSDGSVFNISAIRIVTIGGANVAFGTDTFPTNPFPSAIEHLVVANALAAGQYALEVSGTGNRTSGSGFFSNFSDVTDFTTRLQVTPVVAIPEPESYVLMFAGLGIVAWAARRRNHS